MMKSLAAKDVDSYLDGLEDPVRLMLDRLRQVIRAAAPAAEEIISYRMPAYRYHGMLVYFAAFQKHCSLFVARNKFEYFKEELAPFKTVNSVIQFTVEHPLPDDLVRRIVELRVSENKEEAEMKQMLKMKSTKKKKK